MKEVMAVIRPNKWQDTKKKLAEAGILAFTQRRVDGHGKQMGLMYRQGHQNEEKSETGISFMPKRLVILVVPESQVRLAVNMLIEANQTGAIGDGKIFVSPVDEVIQIRTGDRESQIREIKDEVLQ